VADTQANETQTIKQAAVNYGCLQPGVMIGRYEIVSVLGQGGFGITYRARDRQLDRDIAIKEYLPSSLAVRHEGVTVVPRSTQMADDFIWGRARFLDEAKTMARFADAPAIVRVIEFLEANGTAYVVMPLLQGETLAARLKRDTRLQQPAIERILYPLLDGLEQVHAAGFLHRDIKPANIILAADGSPTLIDFGASRTAMQGRTHAMTAVFTPGYAPLEQFTSGAQGPWTDIYALAATLYACLNGKPPPNALDRVVGEPIVPATEIGRRRYAPGLLAAIDAGLAAKAESRPQTIDQWREILATGGRSVADDATLRLASPPRIAGPASRRPLVLWLAIAGVALIAAGGGAYFALSRTSTAPQTPAEIAASLRAAVVEAEKKAAEAEALARQEAADRRKLEEQRAAAEAAGRARAADEARKKVELDALTRQQAEERAKIERDRAEATARETAEAQARLKELDRQREAAEAERAKAQAAREKAEADTRTAIAAIEAQRMQAEEARRKAEEERAKAAAAEKERDAQAARVQQEEETKARAAGEAAKKKAAEEEAARKAAEEEKTKAEAAAKPAEDAKRAAERDEAALRLGNKDRQKIQVALTALGFDTGGSDGALGPRSRQMIAAWQQRSGAPATGFISAAQRNELLRSAAAAIARWEEEQKKADDAQAAAPAPTPATLAPLVAPSPAATAPQANVPGGNFIWVGQTSCTTLRFPIAVRVTVKDGKGTYSGAGGGIGSGEINISITGDQISGTLRWQMGFRVATGAFAGSGSDGRFSQKFTVQFAGGQGMSSDDVCDIQLFRSAA